MFVQEVDYTRGVVCFLLAMTLLMFDSSDVCLISHSSLVVHCMSAVSRTLQSQTSCFMVSAGFSPSAQPSFTSQHNSAWQCYVDRRLSTIIHTFFSLAILKKAIECLKTILVGVITFWQVWLRWKKLGGTIKPKLVKICHELRRLQPDLIHYYTVLKKFTSIEPNSYFKRHYPQSWTRNPSPFLQ